MVRPPVLVRSDADWAQADAAHIHHVTDDLVARLEAAARRKS
ncbi:MAG TPA: hypothetical protein VJJ77_05040 [Dongiaceae bacterium]|nr:hypothetical protein [Dongiaceae bacterium]